MIDIIIDPGHGGKDIGSGSNKYFYEKYMNLQMSLYQFKRFKELGQNVKMTRYEDSYLSNERRQRIIEDSKADICISNHINNGTSVGLEAVYSCNTDSVLCSVIMRELSKKGHMLQSIDNKDQTIEGIAFMKNKEMETKTIILKFMNSENDDDIIEFLENWRAYSECVVKGICIYFNISYSER